MSSITIGKISTELDKVIPLSWQESYDNAGLLCGNKDVICTGIYVCFDISESVVDKAIENNCNLIVSHHPLVFRAMKRFTGNPIRLPKRPAVMFPKFPLGTQTTRLSAFPAFFN